MINKRIINIIVLFININISNAILFSFIENKVPIVLKSVRTFPKENDDQLLSHPVNLQLGSENNIFVIDQRLNSIFEYSINGKFIKSIGRSGKGPGEFDSPLRFVYDKGVFYISDPMNGRVQILNSKGEYLSSFKVFRSFLDIEHYNNLIIAQQSYESGDTRNISFITIFDQVGNILNRIDSSLSEMIGISGLPPMASSVRIKIFENKIFLLYRYYPIIQIFGMDGKIIKNIMLDDKIYKKSIENNYKLNRINENPNITKLKYLFLAFDVNNNGMYACVYKDDIEIHEYNFNGELKNIYIYKHNGDDKYYVRDIKIINKNEDKEFIILTHLPMPRLEIFKTK